MNACDPTKPHPDAMTPDAPKQRNRTVAVVVTYHPDTDRLMESLRSILPQVHSVIVVDNGSPETALESIATLDRVIVERLETNCGIAFAQNRGFALAKQINAGFVLLLDQDSVASTDMVMRLQAVFDVLAARGARLAAIGPAQLDGLNAGAPRFTRFRRGRYMQIQAAPETTSVACDMLIASGTLIPIEVFDVVGAMNEGLFIDKVDTDWCIRAQRAGYSIHGVPGAALFHRLGESVLTVGWWRGKRLPVHKPFRYYYMVRNSLLLQRQMKMGWAWRFADLSQLLQIIIFHGVFAPNSSQNRPMIWRGLRDGALAVSGPLRQR